MQCDRSQRLREASEVVFEIWYEAVDLYVLKFQSVNIREGGEVAQVKVAKWLRNEPTAVAHPLLHPERFHKME